jgi:hypothetical protein
MAFSSKVATGFPRKRVKTSMRVLRYGISNSVSNAEMPKSLEAMRALTYSDIKQDCKQY